MRLRNGLAVMILLAMAPVAPAPAQSANLWRVSGAISGRNFNMDCRLEPASGVCTQVQTNKAQPLVSFAQSGNRMNWSLKTRVAFLSITVAFDGHVSGERMSGTMTAAGRSGTFTAVRR